MNMEYYFSRALSLPPTHRGQNENGEWLLGNRWDISDMPYPAYGYAFDRDHNIRKLNLNQAFVFHLLEGLEFKVSGALFITDTDKDFFNRDIPFRMGNVDKTRYSYNSHDNYTEQTYSAVLNYNKQLTDKHYVSAMLGAEYYDQYRSGFNAKVMVQLPMNTVI